MPRTGVIYFVEEKNLVEQIIMTNWNPLACEPVKFKTYLAEPTTLLIRVLVSSVGKRPRKTQGRSFGVGRAVVGSATIRKLARAFEGGSSVKGPGRVGCGWL
jgi:hypothetical protein